MISCVCLSMACGHLLCKGWPLGSWLWCVIVKLPLSQWYPGSGVVPDYFDSWSLPSFLLYLHTTTTNYYNINDFNLKDFRMWFELGIDVIITLRLKKLITKCFSVVCILKPFDIISCIVTGICLTDYSLFSFIVHQPSYLKGYQWYFIHREVLVRIDKMLLNNKCEMNWPSRTKIWFCWKQMLTAFFQKFSSLTKCRPDLGLNNHLKLLKYLINPCHYSRIYRYSSFFKKRGQVALNPWNIFEWLVIH